MPLPRRRQTCSNGHDTEYKGLVEAERHNHFKSEYICVGECATNLYHHAPASTTRPLPPRARLRLYAVHR